MWLPSHSCLFIVVYVAAEPWSSIVFIYCPLLYYPLMSCWFVDGVLSCVCHHCVVWLSCLCCFYRYVLSTVYNDSQAYSLFKRWCIQAGEVEYFRCILGSAHLIFSGPTIIVIQGYATGACLNFKSHSLRAEKRKSRLENFIMRYIV